MSHRRRRVSRVLFGLLGLTIAVGLFTYVHKLNSSRAATPTKGAAVAAVVPAAKVNEPPITRAPGPAATPTTAQSAIKQPQPSAPAAAVEAPKAHVTEAPTVPRAGMVTIVATAANSAPPAPAGSPSHATDRTSAAAAPSSASPSSPSKVTIQPYVAPAGPAPAGNAATVLADARAKMQAGNLLEARDLVNGALASGRIVASDAGAARQLLSEISQTVVFSSRRFPDDKWGGTYSVQPGDRLDRIGAKYGLTPAMLMKLNGIPDARKLRSGATIKVLKGPFHAVVNKSAFRLDLYLGAPGGAESVYVTSFPVGLGKDNSTPDGKWVVAPEKKLKNPEYYSPRGEGIIAANDPRNPLGEFWIGLDGTEGEARGKLSYGIHGTIDPTSIGKQASMGCVRMRNEDAAVVFDAVVEGKSSVVVVD